MSVSVVFKNNFNDGFEHPQLFLKHVIYPGRFYLINLFGLLGKRSVIFAISFWESEKNIYSICALVQCAQECS